MDPHTDRKEADSLKEIDTPAFGATLALHFLRQVEAEYRDLSERTPDQPKERTPHVGPLSESTTALYRALIAKELQALVNPDATLTRAQEKALRGFFEDAAFWDKQMVLMMATFLNSCRA